MNHKPDLISEFLNLPSKNSQQNRSVGPKRSRFSDAEPESRALEFPHRRAILQQPLSVSLNIQNQPHIPYGRQQIDSRFAFSSRPHLLSHPEQPVRTQQATQFILAQPEQDKFLLYPQYPRFQVSDISNQSHLSSKRSGAARFPPSSATNQSGLLPSVSKTDFLLSRPASASESSRTSSAAAALPSATLGGSRRKPSRFADEEGLSQFSTIHRSHLPPPLFPATSSHRSRGSSASQTQSHSPSKSFSRPASQTHNPYPSNQLPRQSQYQSPLFQNAPAHQSVRGSSPNRLHHQPMFAQYQDQHNFDQQVFHSQFPLPYGRTRMQ